MQEQEIFKQYELKSWEFSPRLYKILAASGVVNLLFILGLAQGNVLTAKSCDTPIMSSLCSVVDAIYVGSSILDTNTGYVNEDYVKTELDDADITFINLTDVAPPLEYPAGYFAVANPESVVDDSIVQIPGMAQNNTNPTLGNTYIPGITGNTKTPVYKTPTYKTPTYKTPSTSTDLTKVNPIKPKKNNKAVTGDLSSLDINTDPTVSKDVNKTTNKDATKDQKDKKEPTEENQTTKSDPVTSVSINREVLKDYGSYVKAKVEKKEVDLNQPFKVVVEGPLTADGKFDISVDKKTKKAKTQFTAWEGDEQMVDIAKKAIEAIGDSGVLGYLRNLGAEKIKITLIQDGDNIRARIESDMKTESKAGTVASGVNVLLSLAKGRENLNEDEKLLLKGAQKPTSNGSIFIVDFAIPKADAQAMIFRNLEKLPSPTSTTGNQSNSTAQTNKDTQAKTK